MTWLQYALYAPLSLSDTPVPTIMAVITEVKAHAGTDYWRKPPATDRSNAPIAQTVRLPSQQFRSARVTVSADWTRLYDQGGILIHSPVTVDQGKRCWVKAGIEFAGGRPNVSVVSAREWADWSLNPLPTSGNSITIELSREDEGKGSALWVYLVENGRRADLPIREVTWVFEQEGEIEVGLYAARPTKVDDDDSELVVKFENFSYVCLHLNQNPGQSNAALDYRSRCKNKCKAPEWVKIKSRLCPLLSYICR